MKTHLNLLPMSYRRGLLLRRQGRLWCVIWCLAICLTALWGWAQWQKYQGSVTRLAALQHEHAPIVQLNQDIAATQTMISDLQRRESLSLTLADERSMLSLMGLLSGAARQCEGRVSIRALRLNRGEEPGPAANLLTLEGVAEDDFSVARFAAVLRDLKAFHTVELKSSGVAQVNNVEARTYNLECAY